MHITGNSIKGYWTTFALGRLPFNSSAIVYGYVILFAMTLGILSRPPIMVDDAATTIHYVERIVSGSGFTYNDHEHVLGFCNTLYLLLIALMHRLGIGIEDAAFVLGLFSYVGSTLLSYCLTSKLTNRWFGLING